MGGARREGGVFDLVLTPAARPAAGALPLGAEPRLDVSRLDLRVGRVISTRRHPLATTWTLQEVDVGEKVARPVVSSDGEKAQVEEVGKPLRLVRPFVHPLVCPLVHPVIHLFTRSSTRSLVHPFISCGLWVTG